MAYMTSAVASFLSSIRLVVCGSLPTTRSPGVCLDMFLFWGSYTRDPVILGPYLALLILGNSHITPTSPKVWR